MAPLFPSAFEEIIFWTISLAGIFVASLIEDRGAKRSNRSQRSAADRGTYVIANLILFASLAIAITLGYARIAVLPN